MGDYKYRVTGPKGGKYLTTTRKEAEKLTKNGGKFQALGQRKASKVKNPKLGMDWKRLAKAIGYEHPKGSWTVAKVKAAFKRNGATVTSAEAKALVKQYNAGASKVKNPNKAQLARWAADFKAGRKAGRAAVARKGDPWKLGIADLNRAYGRVKRKHGSDWRLGFMGAVDEARGAYAEPHVRRGKSKNPNQPTRGAFSETGLAAGWMQSDAEAIDEAWGNGDWAELHRMGVISNRDMATIKRMMAKEAAGQWMTEGEDEVMGMIGAKVRRAVDHYKAEARDFRRHAHRNPAGPVGKWVKHDYDYGAGHWYTIRFKGQPHLTGVYGGNVVEDPDPYSDDGFVWVPRIHVIGGGDVTIPPYGQGYDSPREAKAALEAYARRKRYI